MSSIEAATTYLRRARPIVRGLVLSPYVAGTELPYLSGTRTEPLSFGRDPLAGYRSELIGSLSAFRRRLWWFRSLLLLIRAGLLAALVYLLGVVLDVTGVAPRAVWPSYRVPWRDIRLLATTAVCIALVGFVASLGLRAPLPDPASSARVDNLDPSLNSWYEVDPSTAAGLTRQQPNNLEATVAKLRDQLDKKEITPLQYASQVAAVEDQLRQQAQESSRQQAALSDLADALSDSSSTRGVAESLNRGNYADAAQELADIGQHANGLSDQARQELADKLSQAAQKTGQNNAQISSAAARAADALQSGDTAASQSALRDLAAAMAQASQSVASQSDLGDTLRQIQQSQGGMSDAASNGSASSPLDQATQDGQPSDQQGDPQAPDRASGQGGANGQGQQAASSNQGPGQGTGGGAGSGRGERIVANGAGTPSSTPEVTGNVLKITGKASGTGTTVRSEGTGPAPLTATGGGTSEVQGSSSGARSAEPVTAIGESNYVPLAVKPVVKDYFSSGGG
jgi:hypothetical protein